MLFEQSTQRILNRKRHKMDSLINYQSFRIIPWICFAAEVCMKGVWERGEKGWEQTLLIVSQTLKHKNMFVDIPKSGCLPWWQEE